MRESRQLFERWADNKGYDLERDGLYSVTYFHDTVQGLWECWRYLYRTMDKEHKAEIAALMAGKVQQVQTIPIVIDDKVL